jgi:ankyrin repeat protein
MGVLLQNGNTPLHQAVQYQRLQAMEQLLDAGAAVGATNNVSSPALLHGCLAAS